MGYNFWSVRELADKCNLDAVLVIAMPRDKGKLRMQIYLRTWPRKRLVTLVGASNAMVWLSRFRQRHRIT